MFVLCYAVYSKSTDKLILEWRITQLGHQSVTFREFFKGPVEGLLAGSNNQVSLLAAYVGGNKIDANPVHSLDMRMFDVMATFGRWVKFIIE